MSGRIVPMTSRDEPRCKKRAGVSRAGPSRVGVFVYLLLRNLEIVHD